MKILLDKSYLQGASTHQIRQLCLQHQVIMPEVLFFEILTTGRQKMIQCFRKLPQIQNPVAIVKKVSCLIRHEINNSKPCTSIETQFLHIRYEFNRLIATGQFEFTEEQKHGLEAWETSVDRGIKRFIHKAIVIDSWFPELSEYEPGRPEAPIRNAINKVVYNLEFVRRIYSQLRDEINFFLFLN